MTGKKSPTRKPACPASAGVPHWFPRHGIPITMDSKNAWHGVAEYSKKGKPDYYKYFVKAAVPSQHNDAIETDAVTCAIIDALRSIPELRDDCRFLLQYQGSFTAWFRASTKELVREPPHNVDKDRLAVCKCTATKFINGSSLFTVLLRHGDIADLRATINSLSKTLTAMMSLSYKTGFVQNDPHLGNLYYDEDADRFVLIDYGKCSFDVTRLKKFIDEGSISSIIRRECCNLNPLSRSQPDQLSDFYAKYKALEQKLLMTAEGSRITRKLAIMSDVASFSFMTWYTIQHKHGWKLHEIYMNTCGLIDIEASRFKIPSSAKKVIERAKMLRDNKTSIFAPLANGLAWMAIYLLSYFKSIEPKRPASPVEKFSFFRESDVMSETLTAPLFISGQTTRHGLHVAEKVFNDNLKATRFFEDMLSKEPSKTKPSNDPAAPQERGQRPNELRRHKPYVLPG